MFAHEYDPLDHPEVRSASMFKYGLAFFIGMALMVVACVITLSDGMSQLATLIWIGILALIAVCAQLYLLFKLDLSKTMIWHTVSAVATIPLFFIAIVLTMWMFHHLEMRTMLGAG